MFPNSNIFSKFHLYLTLCDFHCCSPIRPHQVKPFRLHQTNATLQFMLRYLVITHQLPAVVTGLKKEM